MKIHDETEDRLIFVDSKNKNILSALVLILFGLLSISTFFWIFDNSILLAFIFGIFGVGLVLYGFNLLLIDSKFVIDRKNQKVIIEKKSKINCLNSFEQISFLDIKEIAITKEFTKDILFLGMEYGEEWCLSLNALQAKYELITSQREQEIKRIADNISKIIDKPIFYHEVIRDPLRYDY